MAKIKTKITKVTPKDFVAKVPNETRRKDAETLLKLFGKVTGWKPKMWGPTIVGYGSYAYTYETGHSGEICVVGFSPRGSNLVIYSGMMAGDEANEPLLSKLGKYKTGKGCLYINKLADVDVGHLEKVIKAGVARMKKKVAEKGWQISPT